MQVSQLLKELQRRRMATAIVVGEHGGMDGLVTIEEIVGEIHDEYDTAARPVERPVYEVPGL